MTIRPGADQSSKAAFGKSAFAKTCFLSLTYDWRTSMEQKAKMLSSTFWHVLAKSILLVARAKTCSKISSTRVRYKGWSFDEMRWCHFIEDLRIAKLSADHACRTITEADEIKWNEMNEMSVEKWWNEICGRGKRRNRDNSLPSLRLVHHVTHMEWSRSELGITAVVGERRLTACSGNRLIKRIWKGN